MVDNVKLSRIAIRELEEASDWYEEQLLGLGQRFVMSVKRTLLTIALNPKIFALKTNNCREFLVSDFPYLIIYQYNENKETIKVLHVFHTSRSPRSKYKEE